MTPEERQKHAYNLHYRHGMKWREIGEELGGVSVTRARALANSYEQKKEDIKKAVTVWEEKLVLRCNGMGVVDCLRDLNLLNNPESLVLAGPRHLLKEKKMNRKNLSAIADLLQEFGYVKDARTWLGSKPRRRTHCPHCGRKI
ncbi:MAG TPA: hypothetical protein ENH45_00635 [Nitrospirae bacterium]|nr:hypothetical protein [Nitrospirota bacterium]HDZ83698.1 hypothetical protein [Nitrospirota bacterium]